jgi:hypothetical protein
MIMIKRTLSAVLIGTASIASNAAPCHQPRLLPLDVKICEGCDVSKYDEFTSGIEVLELKDTSTTPPTLVASLSLKLKVSALDPYMQYCHGDPPPQLTTACGARRCQGGVTLEIDYFTDPIPGAFANVMLQAVDNEGNPIASSMVPGEAYEPHDDFGGACNNSEVRHTYSLSVVGVPAGHSATFSTETPKAGVVFQCKVCTD